MHTNHHLKQLNCWKVMRVIEGHIIEEPRIRWRSRGYQLQTKNYIVTSVKVHSHNERTMKLRGKLLWVFFVHSTFILFGTIISYGKRKRMNWLSSIERILIFHVRVRSARFIYFAAMKIYRVWIPQTSAQISLDVPSSDGDWGT